MRLAFGLLVLQFLLWAWFFQGRMFPLNDGAMFLAFAEALVGRGFDLPSCIVYNGDCLPFAYPPLAFLGGAKLIEAGLAPLAVGVAMPVALTGLYEICGLLLLRRVLREDAAFLFAVVFFLFNPRAWEFLIMGGGMSRSGGALFFALAILCAWVVREREGRGYLLAVFGGAAAGGAALFHLEWGIGAAIAGALLTLWAPGPAALRLARLGLAVVAALAVVAPWVQWVLREHGFGPWTAAAGTSGWDFGVTLEKLATLEFLIPLLLPLGLIGAVASLRSRHAVWLVLVVLLQFATPRNLPSSAALAQAVITALGAMVLTGWIGRTGGSPGTWPGRTFRVRAVLGPVLGLAIVGVSLAPARRDLEVLSEDVIAAAEWSRAELPPDVRFAAVTGEHWWGDQASEWFPYFSGHVVLTTPQGTEWLPGNVFAGRLFRHHDLRVASDCNALITALDAVPGGPDHVLATVQHECFDGRAGFERLFREGAAGIWRRVPPG